MLVGSFSLCGCWYIIIHLFTYIYFYYSIEQGIDGEVLSMMREASVEQLIMCGLKTVKLQLLFKRLLTQLLSDGSCESSTSSNSIDCSGESSGAYCSSDPGCNCYRKKGGKMKMNHIKKLSTDDKIIYYAK